MERNFSPLLLLARALRPPVLRAWLAGLALILAAATAQAELRGAVAATGWRDGVPIVSPPAPFRIGLAARRPALSLHAESLAAAFSREGEAVRLRIAARNDGNVTLASPVIEVQKRDVALECPPADPLAPGESLVCEASARVGPADLAAGQMRLSLTALAVDPAGGIVGPVETEAEIAATRADIVTVTEFDAPRARPHLGEAITLRIIVSNRGPEPASNVELAASLPEGLAYLGHDGDGSFDPATGRWKIERVQPGDRAMLTVAMNAGPEAAGRTLTATAQVLQLDQLDGRMEGDRNSASITIASADLVTRRFIEGEARPRATAALVTRIVNRGPDTAKEVRFEENLPEGLRLAGHEASRGAYEPSAGLWRIPALAPGEEAELRLFVEIGDVLAGQEIRLGAEPARSGEVGDISAADDELDPVLQVAMPRLVARDDAAGGLDGVLGSEAVLNVLANDTVDGRPASAPEHVVASLTREGPLALSADGTLRLAPATPAGLYELAYRTCLAALPQVCDDAIARIEVVAPLILARDDRAPEPADGTSGSPGHLDLLANDRRGDAAVLPGHVEVTEIAQEPGSYLELDEDGRLSVPAGTPAGTYRLDYLVCDRVNPDNCGTASATVEVDAPASVAGTTYRDINGSGTFEPDQDRAEVGMEISLLLAGKEVARTRSAADGSYRLAPVPGATGYRVVYRAADGRVLGGLAGLDLLPGQELTELDLATDATGIIYDALDRRPLPGARLLLTDANGVPLPEACLIDPAMQGQVTTADGAYRFALAGGADPACPVAASTYRIRVIPPQGYGDFPSAILPPLPEDVELAGCAFDPVPGGRCQMSASAAAPEVGDPALYAISFVATGGEALPLHNHIPLDPRPREDSFELTLGANPAEIARGGRVTLSVAVRNGTGRDQRGLSLLNLIPPGFFYVEGSAGIDGRSVTPARGGGNLIFRDIELPAGSSMTLRLDLEAEQALVAGRYVHRVRLADAAGTPLAPERAIAVELRSEEAVRCSDIAGRVHLEKDGSGIEGVRIRLDNGHSVRTDATGRFRFACTAIPGGRPGTEVRLFLDLDSLPADMRLNGATPRIVTLAESGEVTVNFTAVTLRVIRLDISGEAFTGDGDTLEPRWLEGVERLVGLLSEEASILRISYRTNRESPAMIRQRLAALSDLVHERWRQIGNPYPLEIRNEILN